MRGKVTLQRFEPLAVLKADQKVWGHGLSIGYRRNQRSRYRDGHRLTKTLHRRVYSADEASQNVSGHRVVGDESRYNLGGSDEVVINGARFLVQRRLPATHRTTIGQSAILQKAAQRPSIAPPARLVEPTHHGDRWTFAWAAAKAADEAGEVFRPLGLATSEQSGNNTGRASLATYSGGLPREV